MTLVSLEQAQANLPDLLHDLGPDDELVVTGNDKPIARIATPKPQPELRRLGTMAGTVLHIAPDLDAPLDKLQNHVS